MKHKNDSHITMYMVFQPGLGAIQSYSDKDAAEAYVESRRLTDGAKLRIEESSVVIVG